MKIDVKFENRSDSYAKVRAENEKNDEKIVEHPQNEVSATNKGVNSMLKWKLTWNLNTQVILM